MSGSLRVTTHLWLKRAALVVLGPLVFFAALEGLLRLSNYGGPTTFFQTVEVDGKMFAVENLRFGQRFFHRHVPRAPGWNLIPEPRSDIPRIAVIGESAAQGFPLQKIGLASMLDGLLQISFPGRSFDFINATMTSVNSHVLQQVISEVASQRPDVAVIYLGNNEVVGPYGPGSPFNDWTGSSLLIETDKVLSGTRIYRLIQNLVSLGRNRPRAWGGFEMFSELRVSADSPSLTSVYTQFRRNLRSMVRELLDSGTKVVLCTVSVNLADWGPTGSSELPKNSPVAELLAKGRHSLKAGDYARAVVLFEQATAGAPNSAEIAFYLGKALQKSGQIAKARKAFEKARDLDEHRFRADSRINEIIRETASEFSDRGVSLVDADTLLADDSLPDSRHFTEHVHLNFDGMLRLGLLVSGAVGPLISEKFGCGPARPFVPGDVAELKQRLFFTPFDEIVLNDAAREVGDLQIFRDRPGAFESRKALAAQYEALRSSSPLSADQLRREFSFSKSLCPLDSRIDESFAEHLLRLGEAAEASRAGKRALARKPNFYPGFLLLANAAQKRGDLQAAESFFRGALNVTPLLPQAWTGIGDIARARGDKERASECYAKALRLDGAWAPAAISLAELQAEAGQDELAQEVFDSLARENPRSPDLAYARARFHENRGEIEKARANYEQALDLDPLLPPGRYLQFVSVNYAQTAARAAFEKYVDRLGDSPVLWGNYSWLLSTSPDPSVRDGDKALALAAKTYDLAPIKNANVYRVRAAAHGARGEFELALNDIARAYAAPGLDARILTVLNAMTAAFESRMPYREKPNKR